MNQFEPPFMLIVLIIYHKCFSVGNLSMNCCYVNSPGGLKLCLFVMVATKTFDNARIRGANVRIYVITCESE